MFISSLQNSKIKNLLKLQEKSRERKKNNSFVVEGIQENKFALENNYNPIEFFICQEIFDDSLEINNPIYVDSKIYEKIALRGSTEGIIGVYEYPTSDEKINLNENSTIIIIDGIEKPGNLGAILRSCDALKVDLLILCDSKIDIYNPNAIRSSVGSIFNVNCIKLSHQECFDFCNNNNIKLYSTYMNKESKAIYDLDLKSKVGLIFGNEHNGVSDFWNNKVDGNFLIPMYGKIDSLNLSNSVAISLYEISRQKFKNNS